MVFKTDGINQTNCLVVFCPVDLLTLWDSVCHVFIETHPNIIYKTMTRSTEQGQILPFLWDYIEPVMKGHIAYYQLSFAF